MAKTKQDYIEQGKRDYHAANTRNTYAMARVRHMKENKNLVNLSWQVQAYREGFNAARAADLEGATLPKPEQGEVESEMFGQGKADYALIKAGDQDAFTRFEENNSRSTGQAVAYMAGHCAARSLWHVMVGHQRINAGHVAAGDGTDTLIDDGEPSDGTTTPDDNVTITLPVDDQFCRDIICTAVEGGSNYWGRFTVLERCESEENPERGPLEYHKVQVEEIDETTGDTVSVHEVTTAAIRAGVALVLSGKLDVHASIVAGIFAAIADKDAGAIDADDADIIMQAATLKQIVYG